MGVKGIFPLIKQRAPAAITSRPPSYLKGKRISLDANLLLFREFMSPLWIPSEIKNKHALWCLRLVRFCRACQISPAVVFDSHMTTPAKARERAKRSIARSSVKAGLQAAVGRADRLETLADSFSMLKEMPPNQRSEVVRQFEEEVLRSDSAVSEAFTARKLPVIEPTVAIDESQVSSVEPQYVVRSPEEISALSQSLAVHLHHISETVTASKADTAEMELLLSIANVVSSPLPSEDLEQMTIEATELVEKLTRRSQGPTFEHVSQCQKWLKECFHLPIQKSPDTYEGECTAALLAKLGYVDYVASDDSDVLIYGVSQLRGFMRLGRDGYDPSNDKKLHKLQPVTIVDFESLVSSLGLKRTSLTDFAILSGTDFTINIRGMGPGKALDLLKKHENIEDLMSALASVKIASGARKGSLKFEPHEDFLDDAEIARAIFGSFPDISQLNNEFVSKEAFESSLHNWQCLCSDDGAWRRAEEDLLSRCPQLLEEMPEAQTLLDDEGLYTPKTGEVSLI
jgi:5'-3' exonuclease